MHITPMMANAIGKATLAALWAALLAWAFGQNQLVILGFALVLAGASVWSGFDPRLPGNWPKKSPALEARTLVCDFARLIPMAQDVTKALETQAKVTRILLDLHQQGVWPFFHKGRAAVDARKPIPEVFAIMVDEIITKTHREARAYKIKVEIGRYVFPALLQLSSGLTVASWVAGDHIQAGFFWAGTVAGAWAMLGSAFKTIRLALPIREWTNQMIREHFETKENWAA